MPAGPQLIGFAREDAQAAALTAAGATVVLADLQACLERAREGDTLLITSLADTMTSVHQLLDVARKLAGRGAWLRSLGESLDMATLTTLAGFEQEARIRASRAGLASARAEGRKGGNTFALSMEQAREAKRMRDEQDQFVTTIATHFGVSRDAIYNALARLEAGETWTVNPHRHRKPRKRNTGRTER